MTDAARLILVGRVAGSFGVRGEVRIAAFGEDPLALLRYRTLLHADGKPALTLLGGRAQKGALIARTREIAVKEAADALRGTDLYAPRDAFAPPEDEDDFYLADLIGLRADTPEGESLGLVKAVHNFGAGDVLEIQPKTGASFYLAFTREIVPEVNVAEGRLTVVRPVEL
jgi:16S rRNA processing protein RimM